MTLQEIITDINARVPHLFSTAQMVIWLNNKQYEIFKDLAIEDIYDSLTTTADEPEYTLPSNTTIDLIQGPVLISQDLTVTEETVFDRYYYCAPDQTIEGNVYYDFDGNLGIYPIPATTGYMIKFRRKKRPAALSASSLTAIPDLNPDFHNLLVYYGCKTVAQSGNNPDVTLANNYQAEYDELEKRLNKYNAQTKVSTPKTVKHNGWW